MEYFGFGNKTTGGANGKIYYVTNLNESGSGSLQSVIDRNEPRIIKFKVHGYIKGKYKITNPNITIDGSDAPEQGVAIQGGLVIQTSNVIVRYLRVRPGKGDIEDAISIYGGQNIVIDHCSVSWWNDEGISIRTTSGYYNDYNKYADKITISNCIIAEGLEPHNFASLLLAQADSGFTIHRNLFAHIEMRPKFVAGNEGSGKRHGVMDFRNNIMFDYERDYATYTSEYDDPDAHVSVKYIKNHLISTKILLEANNDQDVLLFKRNKIDDTKLNSTDDNWDYVRMNGDLGDQVSYNKLKQNSGPIRLSDYHPDYTMDTLGVGKLKRKLLSHIGCSLPVRDSVDSRIIDETKNNKHRKIEHEDSVGGYPDLSLTQKQQKQQHSKWCC